MRHSVVIASLITSAHAYGAWTPASRSTGDSPRTHAGSRRYFLGGASAAATAFALPLAGAPLAASAARDSAGAPGGVLGSWVLKQTGVPEPAEGTLAFEKSGEATFKASAGGDTFPSVTDWKVWQHHVFLAPESGHCLLPGGTRCSLAPRSHTFPGSPPR